MISEEFYCLILWILCFEAPVQQLLPSVAEKEPSRPGETSCFVLAALLLKDLKQSFSHLRAPHSPSSHPLCSFLLSNHTLGEEIESDLFLSKVSMCFCICACVSDSQQITHICAHRYMYFAQICDYMIGVCLCVISPQVPDISATVVV